MERKEIVRRGEILEIVDNYNAKYQTSIRLSKKVVAIMEAYKFRRSDVESVLYLKENYPHRSVYWIVKWRVKYGYSFEEIDRILELADWWGYDVYTIRKLFDLCDRDMYIFEKLVDFIENNNLHISKKRLSGFIVYVRMNYPSIDEFLDYIERVEYYDEYNFYEE